MSTELPVQIARTTNQSLEAMVASLERIANTVEGIHDQLLREGSPVRESRTDYLTMDGGLRTDTPPTINAAADKPDKQVEGPASSNGKLIVQLSDDEFRSLMEGANYMLSCKPSRPFTDALGLRVATEHEFFDRAFIFAKMVNRVLLAGDDESCLACQPEMGHLTHALGCSTRKALCL